MSIVVLRKPENVLSGTTEQVVIGDATRTIDSLQRDADGVVQDITGWTASIIGHSDDLPGVFFDVPGEIVAPASAGVFRWTRVGDFLTQIGEKSRARFTCQVRTVDADGLPGYGAEFGLDFVVDGTGEDTNMNAASVSRILQTELSSGDYRFFSHWAPIPTSGSYPKGVRNPGFADKFLGPCRYISTPSGANKIFEVVEEFVVHPQMAAGIWDHPPGVFSRPIAYTMTLNAANGINTPTDECFQGIELGSLAQAPPWQTTFAASSGSTVLQLRFNFALVRWEVLVWDANAELAPDVYACDYQPGFAVDLGIIQATIEFTPSTTTTDAVFRAYLNGRLAKTVTGGRLNTFSSAAATGAGYFLTNGSVAASGWTEGGFYGGAVYEPIIRTAMPG